MEPSPATSESSRIKKDTGGIFGCSLCHLEERYDYKGQKPPFSKAVAYLEDCYIAKDPFSIPNRGDVLVMGSDCSVCNKPVCLGCSLFYCKRFCRICAVQKIDNFPPQIRAKVNNLEKDYSQSADASV